MKSPKRCLRNHKTCLHVCVQLQEETLTLCPFVPGPGEEQQRAAGWEQNPGPWALKVLLVGKRGVGKSTAGNSLLGRWVFETRYSEESVTQTFKSESRIWRGRKVCVIDTPDFSSPKAIARDLLSNTFPGPHVFLLVIPLGSFNEKDEAVLNTLRRMFGNKFIHHVIILLTRKEDLGNQDLETYLKIRAKTLYQYIQDCKNRYSIFNYKATGEEQQRQVDGILQDIVSLVQQNGDRPCTFTGKGKRCTESLLCPLNKSVMQELYFLKGLEKIKRTGPF